MQKGKIVLIPFPFTDLSSNKIRPCLVLHNVPRSEDCIVIFISSNKGKNNNFDIKVKPSPKNGPKVDSIIKVNKLATLQKKTIIGEIGEFETSIMNRVDQKLKMMFGI